MILTATVDRNHNKSVGSRTFIGMVRDPPAGKETCNANSSTRSTRRYSVDFCVTKTDPGASTLYGKGTVRQGHCTATTPYGNNCGI